MVQPDDRDRDRGVGADDVVAEPPTALDRAHDHRDHRAVAHRLVDRRLDVGRGGGRVAGAHLLTQPVIRVRGPQQTLERPGQRVGGRLVAGQESAISSSRSSSSVSSCAVLVARLEQHREDVVRSPRRRIGAPRRDHLVHAPIDHPEQRAERLARLDVTGLAHLDQSGTAASS